MSTYENTYFTYDAGKYEFGDLSARKRNESERVAKPRPHAIVIQDPKDVEPSNDDDEAAESGTHDNETVEDFVPVIHDINEAENEATTKENQDSKKHFRDETKENDDPEVKISEVDSGHESCEYIPTNDSNLSSEASATDSAKSSEEPPSALNPSASPFVPYRIDWLPHRRMRRILGIRNEDHDSSASASNNSSDEVNHEGNGPFIEVEGHPALGENCHSSVYIPGPAVKNQGSRRYPLCRRLARRPIVGSANPSGQMNNNSPFGMGGHHNNLDQAIARTTPPSPISKPSPSRRYGAGGGSSASRYPTSLMPGPPHTNVTTNATCPNSTTVDSCQHTRPADSHQPSHLSTTGGAPLSISPQFTDPSIVTCQTGTAAAPLDIMTAADLNINLKTPTATASGQLITVTLGSYNKMVEKEVQKRLGQVCDYYEKREDELWDERECLVYELILKQEQCKRLNMRIIGYDRERTELIARLNRSESALQQHHQQQTAVMVGSSGVPTGRVQPGLIGGKNRGGGVGALGSVSSSVPGTTIGGGGNSDISMPYNGPVNVPSGVSGQCMGMPVQPTTMAAGTGGNSSGANSTAAAAVKEQHRALMPTPSIPPRLASAAAAAVHVGRHHHERQKIK